MPFVLPVPLLEIVLVPILVVQEVPVPPTAFTGPAGRALPRPVSFPGGAAAGARAVRLGLDPMQAVFEGGEEDTAPLVVGNAGLFDDGNGCQEGLDGIAVITCAGARHCFGNGTAGDGPVPVHDLLELHLAHRGGWRTELPAAVVVGGQGFAVGIRWRPQGRAGWGEEGWVEVQGRWDGPRGGHSQVRGQSGRRGHEVLVVDAGRRGGTPKLEERGGRGGMGGGGSPMRGRAAGGRLKKGRMEGGFSRRVGGSAFSVGVARPSRESAESREWALGGTRLRA